MKENGTTSGPLALQSIRLHNFLSFSDNTEALELNPLNVLIGPNASGKSNFIEAISLLKSAPADLESHIRQGGGIREMLWKDGSEPPVATLEVVAAIPKEAALLYRLSFAAVGQRLEITDERAEPAPSQSGWTMRTLYYGQVNGRPVLNTSGLPQEIPATDLDVRKSVLSQFRSPTLYPQLTALGRLFESFRFYRDLYLGADDDWSPRNPQFADLPNDYLEENARNLGMILNKLQADSQTRRLLREYLRIVNPDAEDIHVSIEGNSTQIFLEETRKTGKSYPFPATRLSDGTLRWLCLLAILLHPSPPPLVCIEEPELGLHPDVLPKLAQLLIEASQRMQLIVTTHSDSLVDALSDTPEAVIVCEKENGATTLKRLDKKQLAEWLKKYTLGQLWSKGLIGGNRW